LNITASVCAVICVVSIFVAVERYNTNVANVEAMKQMQSSSPFGAMLGLRLPGMRFSSQHSPALEECSRW
jgi:hypothetical protein